MRGFLFGGDTSKKQNEISDERKRLAHAMLQQGMDASPVQSPWQGAARLVQALMGGLAMRRQEQEMGADEPGNDNFAPLPGNPPVPGDRPLYAPLPAASNGRQQPAAAPARPDAGLFAPLPDNGPIPTPRPYRDPMVTTDYRPAPQMAADQPGDDAIALPREPIPSPKPGYRDPEMTTDERRQQPAAPSAGGGGAGSANDRAELQTILTDPVRRTELPAGMRNNNPANLKYVGQHRPGIIGPSENTDQGDPQVVYATPEAGMEHNFWQVMRKYRKGMLTPNQIIAGNAGWTPNSFTAAANIARSMGIGPDDDLRLTDPVMAKKFMRALINQEQGPSGDLYPDSMIEAAIAAQPKEAAAFATVPANGPVPTPRPDYLDSQLTTDERRQQPAAAPTQAVGDPFAPPGKVPVPTSRPGHRDRRAAMGNHRQQAADADVFNGFMDTVKNGYKQRDGSIIKVTNPYGLAAVASTGQSESSFSTERANGSWSDPSQSGKQGTSGGIMSWRNTRLQALYDFAAQKGEKPGEISPQTQAEFFLQEDPRLIARLNAAKSLEEGQRLMNRAWAFKGYDEPGNEEVAHRLTRARSFMPQFQTQGAADPFALPDTPPIPTPRPASGNPRETMNRGREGAGAALVNALLARL
ncbi:hypothetical protein [Rhizobium sp. NLR22b]|uniref:hypothetical protein n=1 Tax=Rhizobium sp. NLR22b TaxID=2731115 RepID=UPI002180C638|nr:hypothetical protein [Rhizobium sp. NLR22b]MBX5239647.1 hypothetical protein [Rhizobium sp. NLR22b]